MALNTKILKLKDHKITVDELWIANTETSTNTELPKDISLKASEVTGDVSPFININEFIFDEKTITSFELNETGFIPTIKVSLIDRSGAFTNKFFPKNKSLMKVYIKSGNKKLKAIRCDFLITNIKTSYGNDAVGTSEGRGTRYMISGVLNVPKINDNQTHVYSETAYNALFKLVDNINLGFASNELSTNDKMSWIQPNMSYQDMIEFIADHAYKDGDSFYTTYIDRYYNLTFLNIFSMLSQEEDFDAMFLSVIGNKSNYDKSSLEENQDTPVDNVLTNYSGHKGLPNYITAYKPSSRQGEALIKNPNRKNMYYYDINASENNSEKFINMFVEPFGSVVTDEEVGKNQINIWAGIDYNNTHRNFIFAENSNVQNLVDYHKTSLNVILNGINLNLIRGMRIPVVIVKQGYENQMNEDVSLPEDYKDADKTDSSKMITQDKQNTGYYVINNIKFIYDQSGGDSDISLKTVLELGRFDWGANIASSEFDKNINKTK